VYAFVLVCLAAPDLPATDVFKAGDAGNALYRIPGIVVTAKGTLLAYCEARKSGASDWGEIMPVCKRSSDAGKTWSNAIPLGHRPKDFAKNPVALAKKVGKATDCTVGNPVMIADPAGPLHLVYTVETLRPFYRRSLDDGLTWSEPVELTAAAKWPSYDWKVLAPGPGHGLRHSRTGRLIVPVWLSTGTGGNAHRPSVVSTLYSDDAGNTWHAGAIAVPNDASFVNPNETSLVELVDGQVLLNTRTESKQHRRVITVGPNGASDWSQPRFADDLVEPICFGGSVRYDTKTLLFVNPANLLVGTKEGRPGANRERKRLTLSVSRDEGKTWAAKRELDADWSGYADLAVASNGSVYVLYERGAAGGKQFNPATLTLLTLTADQIAAIRR
jgi:sialidase-1